MDGVRGALVIKVQSREVAGIGVVAKPYIDSVGAIINCNFQGRQVARRAN
jgi:hypothetical protein